MSFSPSDSLLLELQKRHPQSSFVACWHLTLNISSSERQFVAAVRHDKPVTLTFDDPFDAVERMVTFDPWPVSLDQIRETTDGSLTPPRLTWANVDPQLTEYLEANNALRGMPIYMFLVHKDFLGSPGSPGEAKPFVFSVSSVGVASDRITISMESGALLDLSVPRKQIDRSVGDAVFKSPRCGYTGPEDFCPRTLQACTAYGDLEVARGEPRRHPLMFCGASSMPTSRGAR